MHTSTMQSVFALVLACTAALNTDSKLSCSTSVAVEGRRSSVTCKFPKDVTRTRADIEVLRYDLDEPSNLLETVLSCYWPVNAQSPHCTTCSGYEFDAADLFETATIIIPYTSQRHAGVYKCLDSSYDEDKSSNCSLLVKGNRNSCTAGPGSVAEGDSSFVICHFNSDLRHTKDSFVLNRFKEDGDTDTVFGCSRARHGKFVCTHGQDYLRTSDITRTVIISIPKTGPQHAGQYQCITVPQHEGVTVDSCQLDVTTTTTTSASTVPASINTQDNYPTSHSGRLKTTIPLSIFISFLTYVCVSFQIWYTIS